MKLNIYFWLRFGFANALNGYLRLKIRGFFTLNMLKYTKSESDLFFYIRKFIGRAITKGGAIEINEEFGLIQ